MSHLVENAISYNVRESFKKFGSRCGPFPNLMHILQYKDSFLMTFLYKSDRWFYVKLLTDRETDRRRVKHDYHDTIKFFAVIIMNLHPDLVE